MQRGAYLILLAIAAVVLILVIVMLSVQSTQVEQTFQLSPDTIIENSIPGSSICPPNPGAIESGVIKNVSPDFSIYNFSGIKDYVLLQGKMGKIYYNVSHGVHEPSSKNITNNLFFYNIGPHSTNITINEAGLKVYVSPPFEVISPGDSQIVTVTIDSYPTAPSHTYFINYGGSCFGQSFLLTIGSAPYNQSISA